MGATLGIALGLQKATESGISNFEFQSNCKDAYNLFNNHAQELPKNEYATARKLVVDTCKLLSNKN